MAGRVIAYASCALHDHEKKLTATKLEAAAVIWALETFRHYIDTVELCIRKDHAPLEYIRNNSSQCRRLERWALRPQEVRFKVQRRPAETRRLLLASCPPRSIRTDHARPRGISHRTLLHARSAPPLPLLPQLWCNLLCAAYAETAGKSHEGTRLIRHRLKHLCLAAHADPRGAALAPADDDADAAVHLRDTEDEAPRLPATPRT
ncbi:hypothetical protein ACSSS7_008379 [Eimeria intestinalis]